MTRRQIGELLVSLYPAEIRAKRGEELIGTLLDAGDASPLAFLREAVSLLLAGLIARSRQTGRQPVDDLIRGALGWAAVLMIGYWLMVNTIESVRFGDVGAWGPADVWTSLLAPVLTLVAFVLRRDRLAGICGLAWWIVVAVTVPWPTVASTAEWLLLPLIGFATLALAPPAHRESGRVLIVIPLCAMALFRWPVLGDSSAVAYLLPLLVILVFVVKKPAMALATTFVLTFLAVGLYGFSESPFATTALGIVACTPITVGLIAISRRRDEPAA